MWGARPHRQFFFFKFLLSPEGKKYKIDQIEEKRGKEERQEKEEKIIDIEWAYGLARGP